MFGKWLQRAQQLQMSVFKTKVIQRLVKACQSTLLHPGYDAGLPSNNVVYLQLLTAGKDCVHAGAQQTMTTVTRMTAVIGKHPRSNL